MWNKKYFSYEKERKIRIILFKLFLPVTVVLFIALMPLDLLAAELSVLYSIQTFHIKDLKMNAMIVAVRNHSKGEVQNVQLRLDGQDSISIQKEMFQIGNILPGKAKVAISELFIDKDTFDSVKPVLWRVDYDDAQLNNKQLVIIGSEIQ